MGVRSDFIIANRGDAKAILAARGAHAQRWDTMSAKDIDTIKLATLWELIDGQPVDSARFMRDLLVGLGGDDGPWVHVVPAELVEVLSRLTDAEVGSWASQWGQVEEFELDRWKMSDVERCLAGLAGQARKARQRGSELLLWISL